MKNKTKHNINNFIFGLNIYQLLFIATFLGFIVTMPFLAGLLISPNSLSSQNLNIGFVITAIIVFLFAIHLFKQLNLDKSPHYIHLFIWLIPATYLIAQINAASSYSASLNTFIAIQVALFFIMSYYANRHDVLQKILFYGLFSSMFIIVIYGLMNWFGDASLFGIFPQAYPDAVWESGTGKRLASVFQYANTYATYLIIFALICLFFATLSNSFKQRILFSLPLVPIFVSLMLTSSRWGWLSFPVILLLCLPFLNIKKQLQSIILLVVTGIITLIVLNPITNLGLELQAQFSYGKAALAWLVVIGSASVVAIINIVIYKLFNIKASSTDEEMMHEGNFLQRFTIPIISLLLGVIGVFLLFNSSIITKILPASISERITSINLNQHSVLERFTFYRDALVIFGDYPILGAGGGGWSALYQMYQNNPYLSSEVHSYFIQLLLEVGLIGFIITVAIYGLIYALFLRTLFKNKQFTLISFGWFIITTTILITSALDFHMSFAYMYILLFIALGGMFAHSLQLISSYERVQSSKLNKTINIKLVASIYLVSSIIILVVSSSNLSSIMQYNQISAETNEVPFEETAAIMAKATKTLPLPDMLDFQAELLFTGYKTFNDSSILDETLQTLEKFEKLEPYNERLLRIKLDLYEYENDQEQLIDQLYLGMNYFKWDIFYYEQLAMNYSFMLTQAYFEGEPQKLNDVHNGLMNLEKTISEKTDYLSSLPEAQLQGRVFTFTKPIAGAIGQSYYFQKQYEQAEYYLALSHDRSHSFKSAAQTSLYYAALKAVRGEDYTELLNELVENTSLNSVELQSQIEFLINK